MESTNERQATFSSSSAWKLCTNDKKGTGIGEKGLTYIKQVKHEIALGRAINKETNSHGTDWGNCLERYVFNKLDTSYELASEEKRLFHSEIPNYSGIPDLVKLKIVGDIKCPFSLETFCDKLEALKNIEVYKKEFKEDYWQHISNTILLRNNGVEIEKFEAVIFCPFKEEIEAIKEHSKDYFGNRYNWILNADIQELPYLVKRGKYTNLNIVQFDVNEADVEHLTHRIKMAVKLLNE